MMKIPKQEYTAEFKALAAKRMKDRMRERIAPDEKSGKQGRSLKRSKTNLLQLTHLLNKQRQCFQTFLPMRFANGRLDFFPWQA